MVALAVRIFDSWALEDANQKLGEALHAQEAALVEVRAGRRQLDDALDRERALHYAHSITLAQREWQADRVEEARRILESCPQELRHWEWHYLHRQCHAEMLTIRGHLGRITALAVSPDGRFIAAASAPLVVGKNDRDLKIWDAATGTLVMDLVGHQGTIYGVAFSPDGNKLASVSSDKTIRIWDLNNGHELKRIPGASFNRVALSPDGMRLAASTGAEIRLFDVATTNELFALSEHSKTVHAIAFSANGDQLVSAGDDSLVKLWDLKARKTIHTSRGHSGSILNVRFSPSQDQIVSCGSIATAGTVRGEVRIWNAKDGKAVPVTMTFPFVIHAAAFSADGQRIFCASGEGSVICLDAKTGRTVFTLRGHAGPVYRLILTPAGKQIVTGSADGTIRVWPVVNPEFTEVAHGMPSIDALAFAPDGARLAYSHHAAVSSRRQTATVRLDSIPPADNAVELKLARKLNALAVSPDRGMLATADDEALRLWDLTKAEVRCTIPERAVTGISVSADGQWLATATRNPDVELRPDISLLPAPIVIGQPAAPKPVPAIKIWRSSDGQLERILPGQISVDFSPNGKRIAGAHDGVVKIWDTATGEEVLSLIGPTDPVLKVQFVAGGRKVIGFTQRQAILWDADTGQSMATVNGIRGPAAATPDGRRIVSLHGGLVKWWDAQLGRELLSLAAPEVSFNQLAVSAGGHHIAAAGRNKLVVWQGAWQSRFNAATP